MAVREILLLGDERLYKCALEIQQMEIEKARAVSVDLQDTMLEFRKRYGFGRAIAAPQIGEGYRIIYMNIDGKSTTFVNPVLELFGETFEMWDDCMSFPGLEVRLCRYKSCKISYRDLDWNMCEMELTGDLSELLQHEYDHLDGILAVQKAIDNKAYRINIDKAGCY